MILHNFKPLDPEEAARLFWENPDNVCFPVRTFAKQFGLTDREVLDELCAGNLVAGWPGDVDPVPANAVVLGGMVVAWLNCGSAVAARALAFIRGKRDGSVH